MRSTSASGLTTTLIENAPLVISATSDGSVATMPAVVTDPWTLPSKWMFACRRAAEGRETLAPTFRRYVCSPVDAAP
jgi:hypothetical protein